MSSPSNPACDAYGALLRAAASVASRVNRRLASKGLTASRFGALCALWADGPLCPHELASRLGQTRGNVTMILDNLERRGLVERRREGVNRRYLAVHLTPRGRRLVASLAPLHRRAIAAEMPLSPSDLRHLSRICRRLLLS
ncbi:MAG TPA: MarR family transcriptional regulator [Planctomycetota bacterium]|nr:MarR family transcriptional regulator [Planctomycetota bacterium]